MNKIESINNVTIFTDFSISTNFSQTVTINNLPDQCIVRSISYSGATTDTTGVYLIWSDIINDYIGSFVLRNTVAADGHVFNSTPQTVIDLHNKPMNSNSSLQFVIYRVGVGERTPVPAGTSLIGEIAISLDFIKYKK